VNNASSRVSWHCLAGLLAVVTFSTSGCGDTGPRASNTQAPAETLAKGIIPAGADADFLSSVLNAQTPDVLPHVIGEADNTLLILEIDRSAFEPILIASPKRGISPLQALKDNVLDVVIGSGFVTELHSLQPVGLLQVDGQTLSPTQTHGYTRILGINDKGMGVVHKNTYQRDLFHSALQAGPGIVEQGELDISERDLQRPKYFRSFVGVCEQRWLVGISLAPSHLRTLGQTLLTHFNDQKWQCKDVVNLAGDRQAVLLLSINTQTTAYHGDPQKHKVSLLGFKRRHP
jgi:phosphodiester glycosidase